MCVAAFLLDACISSLLAELLVVAAELLVVASKLLVVADQATRSCKDLRTTPRF